jgi:hypothetical protein
MCMTTGHVVGSLAGWKRQVGSNGCVFKLQVAESQADMQQGVYRDVIVAMNDIQIGSFAREMQRAANRRGVTVWEKKRSLLARIFGR